MRSAFFVVVALMLMPAVAHTQGQGTGRAGKRSLPPRETEIALARSAAPKEVSAGAEIYVLTERGYDVAVRGTNGNACLVSRSWPESLEPQCFDPEGVRTVLQTELRRGAMLQSGASMETITREIEDGLRLQEVRAGVDLDHSLFEIRGHRLGEWRCGRADEVLRWLTDLVPG